ncbi:hemolysin family protein [Enterococcus nangangensis]|uniref:hemolysin family protein n=1 Tax=Enterococcus nangangensis TaxID=2559926 RepID=UPI0010F80F17|nr:hemolysin family protein [Enterococcus nangangensis]
MGNSDPDSQSLIWQILLLIFLTLLNAFFAASEMAVVSINKNRVEQKADEGDKKAQRLIGILHDPNNFLSTIQVGITLINILSGASLADSLSTRLAVVMGNSAVAKNVSSLIILALLTYVSIVFGELYPKRIALNKAEEVANFSAGIVKAVGVIAKPFVWLLTSSTSLLARITPMTFDDEESKLTREEMRYMLETEGVLEDDELEMLQGVFSLDNKVAREVMVPRTDAFMVDIDDDVQETIDRILSENYSRIPVYQGDKDKVVGVLHIKNLLKAAHKVGFANIRLQDVLQEPLFVPETIFIDDLLYELKKTQNQMAILLDEYGGVVGIATLEDLLEEIVGEIDDESDEVENLYTKISENEYYVQGRMLIEEFNEAFDTHLEMPDVDTMAGYLITALGTIPQEGEQLTYDVDHITLAPEEMEGARVLLLKVTFHEKPEVEPSEEPEDRRRFFRETEKEKEEEARESSK